VIEACTCEEILVEFKNVLKDKLLFGDARHLLPLAKYKSIAIVTPADFLKAAIHGKKS
jgi:predicted nucleic acid-binding protein